MPIKTLINESKRQRAGEVTRALIKLGHYLSAATVYGGILIVAAWLVSADSVLRPLASGPAAGALTGLLFVGAGAAVAMIGPFSLPAHAARVLIFVATIAVAAAAAPDLIGGAAGKPIGDALCIGWQAASVFVFVAAAFEARLQGFPRLGQVLAMIGIAPPLASLTGYVYGIHTLHGAMSPATTLLALMLAATPFLLGARTGFMRALMSPWNGGRYGRIQIVSIAVLLFVGGLVLQSHGGDTGLRLAAYVVASILILTLISGYAAIAIERSDYARRAAERALAQLVLHDPLTGLYNRRFLKEQAGSIVAHAERQRIPLAVLMVDIDHFKKFNDEFGHQAGDLVLLRVAQAMVSRLRRGDTVIRYGGEEILVILFGADEAAALGTAEQLRAAIEALDVPQCSPAKTTVSIGVAPVTTTMQDAIASADAALYRAKKAGRNQVVAAVSPVNVIRLASR